jgi:hypothetical protein
VAFNHFDVFTYPLLKGESTQPREESTFDSSIYGRNEVLGYAYSGQLPGDGYFLFCRFDTIILLSRGFVN